MTQAIVPGRRVLTGHQAEVAAGALDALEATRIVDPGHDRLGRTRSDSRNGPQQLHARMARSDPGEGRLDTLDHLRQETQSLVQHVSTHGVQLVGERHRTQPLHARSVPQSSGSLDALTTQQRADRVLRTGPFAYELVAMLDEAAPGAHVG